ncbi:MAG: aminodeoxychorismate synthase component I [Rhodospirillales bacterium]|nr:aminodeoxychorismate synthase component I [Alphaproteobacteria bacterium]MCB9981129.1 aminodeoxychorismate synthase component I [Rhodospirillales bacterium]
MTPFIRELPIRDPLEAFSALEHLPYSLLFDSADLSHPNARYSFIVSHPIETLEYKNGVMQITNWEEQLKIEGEPFKIIKDCMKKWVPQSEPVRGLPPFQGGLAGYFGYDLGRTLEKLPEDATDNPDMPDLALGIYDQVLAFDHQKDQAWIITHAPSYHEARRKQDYVLGLIKHPTLHAPYQSTHLEWESNFDACSYMDMVDKVIEYIKAGDIFQANVSQRFDSALPAGFSPFAHYRHLREVNAAPFACYMNCGDIRISSASPERFLTVKDTRVETRPIKGTRPHIANTALDQKYREELETSEKDRAENTMIVDLLRNDLSKVCKVKSIEVSELCKLETFANVHHLVSTVRGQLKSGKTPLDLMQACFPGGSITGAPKIRAMEIIEELEPSRRGPYCGAMGYVGFDGTMDSNILIRTLVYEGTGARQHVSFQVGGGVTADSQPEDEYQETFHKAEGLFRSFETDHHEIEEEILLAG